MGEFLAKFDSEQLIGLVAVVGALLCATVAIIGGFWFKLRQAEIAAGLKHEMLSRGMSADEIRTVLESGTRDSRSEDARRQSRCDV